MNRHTIYISDRARNLVRSILAHPNSWVKWNMYRRLGQCAAEDEGMRLAYSYVTERFNESGFRKRWTGPKTDTTVPIEPDLDVIEKLAPFFE